MTKASRRARRTWYALLTVLILGAGVSACRSAVPIGRLLDDPYQYDGRRVKIEGRVTEAVGALGRGAYAVNDGTGVLMVVRDEQRGGVPRRGSLVEVTGRFKSIATIGSVSAAVMLESGRTIRERY